MSTTYHNNLSGQLSENFHFTSEDLRINRTGRFSSAQITRIYNRATVVTLIGLLIAFIILYIFLFFETGYWAFLFPGVILIGVFVGSLRLWRIAKSGVVEVAIGPVSFKEVSIDVNYGEGFTTGTQNLMCVGD